MGKAKFGRNTRTTRELRRMAEREQKHNERQKAIDAFWALSPEERKRRMEDNKAFERINRNGITLEDLKLVEDQGRRDGYQMGTEESMKACYAAMCLALHEQHGFDMEACMAMLRAADEKVIYALNAEELLAELKEKVGIEFSFKEAMSEERIVGVEE